MAARRQPEQTGVQLRTAPSRVITAPDHSELAQTLRRNGWVVGDVWHTTTEDLDRVRICRFESPADLRN
jgi:hypothetical protein